MPPSPLTGPKNASSILDVNVLRNPALPAVTERNGRSVTYAQLAERSSRLACALLDAGLQPGDRVAAWMADSVYYVELLFAAASSGMVLVPVNVRLTPREVSYILASAEPRLLFVDSTTAPQLPEVEPGGYSVVMAEAGPPKPGHAVAATGAAVAIEGVMSRARLHDLPRVPPSSPLLIGYTSGTTGSPKGVVMTHGSMRTGAEVSLVALRIPHYGRAAYTGSFSFSALFAGHLLPHLLAGGHVILMGKWDMADLRRAAEKWRPTFTFMPTPRLEEFRESLDAFPESWRSLITVVQGGSSASSRLLEEISARIPGVFVRGWGMTENSGVMLTVTSAIDPEAPARDGGYTTVGRANIDTLIRTESQPESGDDIGELVVSTRSLMAGYWNDDQSTSAVLRDGWYYTGDIGRVAADGQVYVTDRRHDLIVSGGMNVYPSEVESWILEHPGVAECAVVGIPHPRWGRAVAAAVVPATRGLTSGDVIGWVRSGLASYKKPTLVDIRGAIPRDDRGKVDRRRLSTELATLSKV